MSKVVVRLVDSGSVAARGSAIGSADRRRSLREFREWVEFFSVRRRVEVFALVGQPPAGGVRVRVRVAWVVSGMMGSAVRLRVPVSWRQVGRLASWAYFVI